jgi:cytochrome c biogenesis protein CcdA
MFEQFLAQTGQYIQTNAWLAMAAVFIGGLLTASNPCVLAMIPLMIGFVAGKKEEGLGVGRAFLYSLVFVLGLSLTFVGLGIVAALAGQMYGDISGVWKWVVAAVCVLMGLHMMGVVHVPIPAVTSVQPKTQGIAGALVMGLLFGVVSAPCAAPILIVLLTYIAGSGASVAYGAVLLLFYSLGHSVLVLLAGTSMGLARSFLESRNITRTTDWMRRFAGAVIVVVGFFFAWSALN